jgi:UTP-glucose-1-phosphate uridylyltransferase
MEEEVECRIILVQLILFVGKPSSLRIARIMLVSTRYCLDTVIYDNLQDLEEQDSDHQQLESGKCP